MAAITADLKTKDLAADQLFVALHFFHEVSRAGGPKGQMGIASFPFQT